MTHEQLKQALEVWAADPNRIGGVHRVSRLMWLRRMCLPIPPHSVLDLGCAEGGILSWIAGDIVDENLNVGIRNRQELICAGVDVLSAAIKDAKSWLPNGDFKVFDLQLVEQGTPLPFEDKSYDIVLTTEVIEHLFDYQWEPLLQDVKRVCRKQVLLTMPDGGRPDREEDWQIRDHNPTAAELYIGHQYEPSFFTWMRIMSSVFGARVQCCRILGFFTAHYLVE